MLQCACAVHRDGSPPLQHAQHHRLQARTSAALSCERRSRACSAAQSPFHESRLLHTCSARWWTCASTTAHLT